MPKYSAAFTFQISKQSAYILLFCYLLHYILFFILPHFSTTDTFFQIELLPPGPVIGMDHYEILKLAKEPLAIAYSPLSDLIFTWVAQLPFAHTYLVFSIFTVLALAFTQWLNIRYISESPLDFFAYTFLIIFSLTSYPFAFELERGQINVITIGLMVFAIVNMQKKRFGIAAIFYGAAAALKIYPLIYALTILAFKPKLKEFIRFGILASVFTASFFLIRGWSFFKWFTRELSNLSNIKGTWIGNNSIKSFLMQLNMESAMPLVLAAVLSMVLIACWLAYKVDQGRYQFHLFTVLTIAACAIPNVSHDYKLALLIIFMPVLLAQRFSTMVPVSTAEKVTFGMAAFLYLFLLTPYEATYYIDSLWLKSKFPALMLLAVVLIVDGLLMLRTTHIQRK